MSETLLAAAAEGDLETLESEWLAAAESVDDVQSFLRVVEVLRRRELDDHVRILLELLDDQLCAQEEWEKRLELLQAEGRNYVRAGHVHETVMQTVEELYSSRREQLEQLLPQVGLDGAKDSTPKLWDKVHRLRNLLIYEEGTLVAMSEHGVGRVVEVNLPLQTLKVEFETKPAPLSVGFRAAGKMLEVLPEGHVLRDKVERPETLESLDPPALLRRVLESYDRPLAAAEIRRAVAGLVPEGRWTSWWGAARKHPQVLREGTGSRQSYRWAASESDAEEDLWSRFNRAKLSKKIDLYRKAQHQSPELLARMAAVLSAAGQRQLGLNVATALVVWSAIEQTEPDWNPARALAESDNLRPVFADLSNRTLRERAYEMVRNERDDWREQYLILAEGEEDPRTLDLLYSALREESEKDAARLADVAVSQPAKRPALFTWLAERAAEHDALRQNPLRLLRLILASLADPAFSDTKDRLAALCETGGTIPRLVAALPASDAAAAATALEQARGLQSYQRQPLLTALRLRFPELEADDAQPLYTTRASYDAKVAELKALVEEEIPANRKAIEVAREMGDLRENFEYKSARQRHEYLASRAANLDADLRRAEVLDLSRVDPARIRVGTRVQLRSASETKDLTVLGPWESAPERGVISFESDLAKSLLGKTVGDQIEIGDEGYVVESIVAVKADDLPAAD